MKLIAEASRKIAERLSWCTVFRDQAGIASDLAEGKEISEVHGLGDAGLYDEDYTSTAVEGSEIAYQEQNSCR